jgi:hypothetical protein
MHINIILYKITSHISILAIQCIQGVFGTVVFQGYNIANWYCIAVPISLPVPVRSTCCLPDQRNREMNFEYFSNILPNFMLDMRVRLLWNLLYFLVLQSSLASTGFSSLLNFYFFPQLVDHISLIPVVMSAAMGVWNGLERSIFR